MGHAKSIEDPLPPPSCCSSALYLLADSALASGDMTARLAGVTVGDILVDFVSWASHDRGQGARHFGLAFEQVIDGMECTVVNTGMGGGNLE